MKTPRQEVWKGHSSWAMREGTKSARAIFTLPFFFFLCKKKRKKKILLESENTTFKGKRKLSSQDAAQNLLVYSSPVA